ncbi:MAG: hypothetical protein ABI193_16750, partial [Minicystis sp.]
GHKMVAEEIATFLERESLTGFPGSTPLHVPRLPPAEEILLGQPAIEPVPLVAPAPSSAASAP